jgi:hypothetical protein
MLGNQTQQIFYHCALLPVQNFGFKNSKFSLANKTCLSRMTYSRFWKLLFQSFGEVLVRARIGVHISGATLSVDTDI